MTFNYNTSIHTSAGFTPFRLVFGKSARFPITIPASHQLSTYNTYLKDLMLRSNELKTQAGRRDNKFDPYYDPPAKLEDLVGRNNAILLLPNGKRIRKYLNKLKLIPEPKTLNNHR